MLVAELHLHVGDGCGDGHVFDLSFEEISFSFGTLKPSGISKRKNLSVTAEEMRRSLGGPLSLFTHRRNELPL